MMKKRILAVLLCLCMVLSVLPMAAFAQDAKPVLEISGTGTELDQQYTSITEAVMAYIANGFPVCTMKLLDDAELAIEENFDMPFGIMLSGAGLVLDLGGHTLTVTGTGFAIWSAGDNVIQNGKIVLNSDNLVGIVNGNHFLEIRDVQITAGENVSDVVGIMGYLPDTGIHLTGTTIKNCQVMLGDKGSDIVDEQPEDEHEEFKTFIYSGQFSSNPVSEGNTNIVYAEGSSELTNPPSGVTGTVITSPDTTALIVKDGNAYLYDTLQDAVNAAKSKQTGSEAVQISLLKQPESTTVTVPADMPLNIKPLDSTGSAINTEDIKLESSTGEKLEITESGTVEAASTPVTSVALDQTALSLAPGETATLAATVEPENATDKTVTWTSSDENVATVDENGVVTAVAAGEAVITAAAGEKSAACTVTVNAKVDPWYPPYIPVIPPVLPVQPTQPATPEVELPFLDVSVGAPYYEAVKYVYGLGLMVGTSDTAFSPNGMFTRAQVATILFRMENCPETAYAAVFPDVAEGQWFDQAIIWGNSKGILLGYDDGSFGPDNAVTLEQLLTILYRYAGSKDWDTAARADVTGYDCSDYAADAVSWAVANGLVDSGSALLLKQPAARWQVAVVLTVFCKTIIK